MVKQLLRPAHFVFALLFISVFIVNICDKKYELHISKWLTANVSSSTNSYKEYREEKSIFTSKKIPVICIGAKKCGTTAIQEFLRVHPHFVPAEINGGELHFFDTMDYYKGFNFYRSQMPVATPLDITFEKSPKYFYTPMVPNRIKEFNPDIKLVLILCDPVNRTLSDFVHVIRRSADYISKTFKVYNFTSFDEFVDIALNDLNRIKKDPYETLGYSSFDSFVQNAYNPRTFPLTLLTNGMYAYHLKNWLTLFSQDQIHLVDGDSLLKSPGVELERLQKFMGLKVLVTSKQFYFNKTSGFHCMVGKPCLKQKGTTKGMKGPHMSKYARQKLLTFFKPYNDELFALIRKTLNWQ